MPVMLFTLFFLLKVSFMWYNILPFFWGLFQQQKEFSYKQARFDFNRWTMEFALYIFWYLNTFRLQKRSYQNCVMRYEQCCCCFLEQGGGWGPSIYAFLQTFARLVKFMFYAYFCGTFFSFPFAAPILFLL